MASKTFGVCKDLRDRYWAGKVSPRELHEKTTAMIVEQGSFGFNYIPKKRIIKGRKK